MTQVSALRFAEPAPGPAPAAPREPAPIPDAHGLVDILLEQPVGAKFQDGNTTLHYAVQTGSLATVRALVEERGARPGVENDAGWNALHLAALMGLLEIAEYLVATGRVAANGQNADGISPLHVAAAHNQGPTVQFLLQSGADACVRDVDGRTPAYHALSEGHDAVFEMLISAAPASISIAAGDGSTLLHLAALLGNVGAIVKLIEEACADFDLRDATGETPLHAAVHSGNAEAVQCLLDVGANANLADSDGLLPLHVASQQSFAAAVRALVSATTNTSAPTVHGASPWHLAVDNEVRQLLPASAQLTGESQAVTEAAAYHQPEFQLHATAPAAEGGLCATVRIVRTPLDAIVANKVRTDVGFQVAAASCRPDIGRLVVEATVLDPARMFVPVPGACANATQVVGADGVADFSDLVLTMAGPGSFCIQFNAYARYGTAEQQFVGFSDRFQITVVDSAYGMRDEALRALLAAAGVDVVTLSTSTPMAWILAAQLLQVHFARAMAAALPVAGVAPSRSELSAQDLAFLQGRLAASASGFVQLGDFKDQVWAWLHAVERCMIAHPVVREMWHRQLIHGFSKRDDFAQVLQTAEPGSCVVRFSEKSAGDLAVGYLSRESKRVCWLKLSGDMFGPNENLADVLIGASLGPLIGADGSKHDPAAALGHLRSPSPAMTSYVKVLQQ